MPMPLPKTEDLSTFDPFSLPFRNDPLAFHPQLLAASPGFIMMEGVRSAYIARHDHVMAVLRDWKNFSSVKPKIYPAWSASISSTASR